MFMLLGHIKKLLVPVSMFTFGFAAGAFALGFGVAEVPVLESTRSSKVPKPTEEPFTNM